ncbi:MULTISPECIES: hypothetical protein [unclassified Streptomyces]|uniref:hypothetical protein n=1 Tax=unclassified Streptomyces TaxID=2593676 RepID=UPI002E2D3832|nr:hypothetical protein [Streptomyces sp. NBC_00223]
MNDLVTADDIAVDSADLDGAAPRGAAAASRADPAARSTSRSGRASTSRKAVLIASPDQPSPSRSARPWRSAGRIRRAWAALWKAACSRSASSSARTKGPASRTGATVGGTSIRMPSPRSSHTISPAGTPAASKALCTTSYMAARRDRWTGSGLVLKFSTSSTRIR